MKKITLGWSVIIAAGLFLLGCNKKTNTPPVADTEFQSSKDVAFATSMVTDIETICSYMGENLLLSSFLTAAPGTAGGSTISTINFTATSVMRVDFTNSVTCKDGKKRNGSITIDYSGSDPLLGAKFYRDAGYVGKVTLSNYDVDGWAITTVNPLIITNNAPAAYNPATTNLSWTINGDFTMKNLNDTTQNMSWKGKIIKTLTNTSDVQILASNKQSPINWVYYLNNQAVNGAKVQYTGAPSATSVHVTGVTSRTTPYSLVIKSDKPLLRDFVCAPDKVLGVTSSTTTPITVTPVYSEWHPFVNGTITFTTGSLPEPRFVNFGADDGSAPCDNAGTVTIKGISYPLDFRNK
jgi:hypothetical protein